MIKKEGKYLANARVDVDYSKGKPKVKFSYPGKNPKRDSLFQGVNMFIYFTSAFLLILIPSIVFSISNDFIHNNYESPSNCSKVIFEEINYYSQINISGNIDFYFNETINNVNGFNLTCDNQTAYYRWSEESNNFYESTRKYKELSEENRKRTRNKTIMMIYIAVMLILILPINMLSTKILSKYKWYRVWTPKVNANGLIIKKRISKYKKFTSKDLVENIAIIPNFGNVVLEYKTEGDFSKYLDKIKIREYRTRTINTKTKKIGKEKVDKFKWYAVFYFKQKPIKGHLEVIYK